MLMSLGPVTFDAVRRHVESHGATSKQAFAKYEVIQGDPTYENMGGDEASFQIQCKLHPFHFGGRSAIMALESAQKAGVPLPLMMGTGEPLGWVLIQSVEQQHKSLAPLGYGMEIDVTIEMIRCGTPAGLAQVILGLFQ